MHCTDFLASDKGAWLPLPLAGCSLLVSTVQAIEALLCRNGFLAACSPLLTPSAFDVVNYAPRV
ncbi:MAG: hypothetical protein KGJ82_17285, partial [Nitrospirota bacterium]|nr:hypothetical protein [Nitrospirota bacterium]